MVTASNVIDLAEHRRRMVEQALAVMQDAHKAVMRDDPNLATFLTACAAELQRIERNCSGSRWRWA
jgi:hypothetical protein